MSRARPTCPNGVTCQPIGIAASTSRTGTASDAPARRQRAIPAAAGATSKAATPIVSNTARRPLSAYPSSARRLRPGKVFIYCSQNFEHKSMVCACSVRARSRPTVSTPLTWEELEAATEVEELVFEMDDVLQRVAHGDLFAMTARQPTSGPSS
jgi:DNA primase